MLSTALSAREKLLFSALLNIQSLRARAAADIRSSKLPHGGVLCVAKIRRAFAEFQHIKMRFRETRRMNPQP